MNGLLLVTDTPDLAQRFAAASPITLRAVPVAAAPDPTDLVGYLPADGELPDLLVLDGRTGGQAALAAVSRLRDHLPALPVVLVSEDGPDLALAALRAGVDDIVPAQADPAELLAVLTRVLKSRAPAVSDSARSTAGADHATPTGRVISVVSPKGGVGKTTVATNLAVGLARIAPRSTVLVDLDIQFGDVASGLSLDPEYFLPAMMRGPAIRDSMVLKTFLTLHETGLYAICAPEAPAEADQVSAADVGQLLETLATDFRYIVVDTAPGLSDHTLAAMDASTDLILLSSLDVPGLRGLRKELDTVQALGLKADGRHVVLNFYDRRVGLSVRDIEATIGAPVDVMLPRSKAVPASVNLGVPLLQSGRRNPVTKQLRHLVTRLAPGTAASVRPVAAPASRRTPATSPTPRRAANGRFRRARVAST